MATGGTIGEKDSDPGEITVLLRRWSGGDQSAIQDLMPLVYPHLHQVAGAFLRREAGADTLQPTALLHEVYLKLLEQRKANWNDRAHFYTFAARLMRRILADYARAAHAEKRGGHAPHVPLSTEIPWVNVNSPEILDLNRALDELETLDARKVRLVELRWFLGCTVAESASLLGISIATAERDLTLLRSWLYSRLRVSSTSPLPS